MSSSSSVHRSTKSSSIEAIGSMPCCAASSSSVSGFMAPPGRPGHQLVGWTAECVVGSATHSMASCSFTEITKAVNGARTARRGRRPGAIATSGGTRRSFARWACAGVAAVLRDHSPGCRRSSAHRVPESGTRWPHSANVDRSSRSRGTTWRVEHRVAACWPKVGR